MLDRWNILIVVIQMSRVVALIAWPKNRPQLHIVSLAASNDLIDFWQVLTVGVGTATGLGQVKTISQLSTSPTGRGVLFLVYLLRAAFGRAFR